MMHITQMNIKHIHLKRNIATLLIAVAALAATACQNHPTEVASNNAFTNLEDLDGHVVGVVAGSTSDMMLSDTDNFPNITLVRFSSPRELVESIAHDSVEFGINDTVSLMDIDMAAYGIHVNFNLVGGYDVAAAFNSKDAKLRDKFNDFLIQIKSDGTLDSMFSHWCNGNSDTLFLPNMPELADLKGHPIEVATITDNAPFSFYRDNHWTGLEVELMMRFSLYINRPFHFSGYRFDEIIPTLLSGKAEIAAASLFITPSRSDKLLFSTPYYFCKTSCFSKHPAQ